MLTFVEPFLSDLNRLSHRCRFLHLGYDGRAHKLLDQGQAVQRPDHLPLLFQYAMVETSQKCKDCLSCLGMPRQLLEYDLIQKRSTGTRNDDVVNQAQVGRVTVVADAHNVRTRTVSDVVGVLNESSLLRSQ